MQADAYREVDAVAPGIRKSVVLTYLLTYLLTRLVSWGPTGGQQTIKAKQ